MTASFVTVSIGCAAATLALRASQIKLRSPMIVTRTAAASFTAEFESEEELRAEHRANLSAGGLRLATAEKVPQHTALTLTLRGPFGGTAEAKATVVAQLTDGLALFVDGDPSTLLETLLVKREEEDVDPKTSWDRVRARTQMEKMMLAARADRTERAVLVQDNDPRVLLSVLRNPRLTVEEVMRIAKSSFLNFQVADVIMATGQWMANVEVRLALIRNPKTPQAFALRILPTLPDTEVRAIAKGGTNMALKQAALRRLQGKQ